MIDTEIQDETAKEIAIALSKNQSITHINLGWNIFSPKYLDKIKKLSNENMSKIRSEVCPQQIMEIKRLERCNDERSDVENKFKIRMVKKQEVEIKFKETDAKFENMVQELTTRFDEIKYKSNKLTLLSQELDK